MVLSKLQEFFSVMTKDQIRVINARQNNLKDINVTIPVGVVTVITGVAGAGKSSLAFDVLYAEGYRRYVETFSPYARQFLERLDSPDADSIEGVLPAISIARTSPVQTSRSTVGTMTSLDDYLRLLFARISSLYCRQCGRQVHKDNAENIFHEILGQARGKTVLICFSRPTGDVSAGDIRQTLEQGGFSRVLEHGEVFGIQEASLDYGSSVPVTVVLDRIKVDAERKSRMVDSIEAALEFGRGSMEVWILENNVSMRFSSGLQCPHCSIDYTEPEAAMFSFNNPVGACENCNGFGRIIDIDPDLVIPDQRLTIAQGAIRPFQTPAYFACQKDLLEWMKKNNFPADRAWKDLDESLRAKIWKGEGDWYGIEDFFSWLKSKRYRKHARIFLSRFRRYQTCPDCGGDRLKPESLQFFIQGKNFAHIQQMAIDDALDFFQALEPDGSDRATDMLLSEIRDRLGFLSDVGLGYLSLGRQSRTLSGGETQRVTLATALGASLTSTLYVLDEPSVGLHPGDKQRLAGVLRKLARAGNAVVVVEHDPVFIQNADRIIDLGPGPGAGGGHVVHQGTAAGLIRCKNSKTGRYFRGDLEVFRPDKRRKPGEKSIEITGAREHNLKDLDVEIYLGLFVCITGVSGSGKSTLMDHVLYRNLRRKKGLEMMEPGLCEDISGHEYVSGAVLVDQSPLSRNTRMNAATYMRVLDPLRTLFGNTKAAKQMGLSKSAFSFNTPAGACPHCQGAGYERVELQFLPDVYIRCPGCDGRRFRPYVLDVRCRGYNIAEVLDLSVKEVADLFSDKPAIVSALLPMLDIGLGYLCLSQSAPTLSGGEAQRLKLARHLAEAGQAENMLFLLDEPTTGLHPDNVADLARVLHRLVDSGHSVVVIEHDMDLAGSADWIIDMGPEGGENGGRIVGQGTFEQVAALDTLTAKAFRGKKTDKIKTIKNSDRSPSISGKRFISIHGAREHNLADISVQIPKNRLVCITGVSGSGKSTLAFDVLYSEGRERFLDCLPVYARQYMQPLSRPDVDRIESLPPTVALEQKVSRAGAMSTAGTASEVYHYLRLLFSALGTPFCPNCGVPGQTADAAGITRQILRQFKGEKIQILSPLVRKRKGYHADVIAGAAKDGFKHVRIDGKTYPAASPPGLDRYSIHDVEAVVAEIELRNTGSHRLHQGVKQGLEAGAGTIIVTASGQDKARDHYFSTRRACPECGAGLPQADPRLFTWSQQFGACPACQGTGRKAPEESETDNDAAICPVCKGSRLRPEALAVRINGLNIGQIAAMTISEVQNWLNSFDSAAEEVSSRVMPEISARLKILEQLGVGYLTLDRPSQTLSTGEAQRVRIAAEISSNLRGVCYVLDEPTVGLHPKNARALVSALLDLRDRGNTVVVVEHEEPVIRAADHVIDLGPGAGKDGGRIAAWGSPGSLMKNPASVTGKWLNQSSGAELWRRRSLKDCSFLTLSGICCHNLKDVNVSFPLGRLVCVTGVSGSGKSTLVRDVTYKALKAYVLKNHLISEITGITGAETVKSVKEVDESPIGRTPRSVPATYVGIMNEIRKIFAMTPEARARGYNSARFSFNVAGGRCDACGGQGRHRVEMPLLPVVHVPCGVCAGRRYNPETLAVKFKDRSIAGVLEMTVDEAVDFFSAFPKLVASLRFLSEIGLGYVRLGQPSPTLSGGEAQRMKLAAELAARSSGGGFYVLDEPTTGLHMADVAKLVSVLQQMVDRGDTVVVIEHDLDLIAAADCVIDMGPEGGHRGGTIVAWGSPEDVAKTKESDTGLFLASKLMEP